MNRLQYLLTKLAEEASEISQIALKTQQFGLYEMCQGLNSTNEQRIHQEINDLLAIVDMLNKEYDFGFEPDETSLKEKTAKVNKYWRYSKDLGMTE